MSENLWTWVEPSSEHKLEAVQDAVAAVLPDEFETVDEFHVSILPGVEVPEVTGRLLGALSSDAAPLRGRELAVLGLRFFPEEEPHVVMLNASIPRFDTARNAQRATIELYDGELVHDPVPAHITLAKAGDGEHADAGLTDEQVAAVRDAVADEPTHHVTGVADTNTDTY